jgi:N-acetylmuramoyl-L-alanine amidase
MRSVAVIIAILSVAALAAFALPQRSPSGDREAFSSNTSSAAVTPSVAWTRPEGPVRVALQAGHWKAAEAPEEQARLRTNGTRGGGKAEWEVNLGIARHAARILEDAGYTVDILPTTIPPGYWADVFVAIHADGNDSPSASGYRAAAPRRDRTGRAAELAAILTETYGAATGLPHYPLITRRMRGYYAFNSRRYHHALHPMTVGVIIETGFLTSPLDRRIIVGEQERAARGIADGVKRFLPAQDLDTSAP